MKSKSDRSWPRTSLWLLSTAVAGMGLGWKYYTSLLRPFLLSAEQEISIPTAAVYVSIGGAVGTAVGWTLVVAWRKRLVLSKAARETPLVRTGFLILVISTLLAAPIIWVDEGDLFAPMFPVLITWSVLFGIFLFAKALGATLQGRLDDESWINEPHHEALLSVVKQLRRRSRFLKSLSVAALILVGVVIFFGVMIFLQASNVSPTAQLIRSEQAASSASNLEARRDQLQSTLDRIQVFGFAAYATTFSDELTSVLGLPTGRDKSLASEEVQQLIDELRASQEAQENLRAILEREIATVEDAINSIVIQEAGEPETGEKERFQENLMFLISTSITRLGIALLLLFLVRILLGLYRYSLRLSAFYDARADCIQASKVDSATDLTLYLAFFSTDTVGFDKVSDPPYDHLVQLAGIASGRHQMKDKESD